MKCLVTDGMSNNTTCTSTQRGSLARSLRARQAQVLPSEYTAVNNDLESQRGELLNRGIKCRIESYGVLHRLQEPRAKKDANQMSEIIGLSDDLSGTDLSTVSTTGTGCVKDSTGLSLAE